MRPPRSALPAAVLIGSVLAACGGGGASVTATPTPLQQDAAVAAGAAGIATDAAVSQLYAGAAIPVAWQPRPQRTMHDGPTIDQIALTASSTSDDPPAPSTGTSVVLDNRSYRNPAWVGGTIAWTADTTGMNPGWYHIAVTFNDFAVRDDAGNVVTIAGGGFDIWVRDQLVANDGHGNWERRVDHYPAVPASAPLEVAVTAADGSRHAFDLVGQRHAARDIVRTRTVNGAITTVTRSDAVTVDGDYGAMAGSGSAYVPAADPTLADRLGNPQVFTDWLATGTGSETHNLEWNRYGTYRIRWSASYTSGTPHFTWSGAVSDWSENIYLTVDGVRAGPFTAAQVRELYGIAMDPNHAGAGM